MDDAIGELSLRIVFYVVGQILWYTIWFPFFVVIFTPVILIKSATKEGGYFYNLKHGYIGLYKGYKNNWFYIP
jgi:hypothetical protein